MREATFRNVLPINFFPFLSVGKLPHGLFPRKRKRARRLIGTEAHLFFWTNKGLFKGKYESRFSLPFHLEAKGGRRTLKWASTLC